MEAVRGTFRSSDGKTDIAYNIWEPSSPAEARAVVQISHGMCEYSGRYAPYAEHLTGQGYIVAGNDHIGHGLSAASPDDLGYIPPEDGPELLVADLHSMTLLLKERYPGKPVVLLGHSMGSFIARYYLSLHAEELEGAVIMGTAGPGAPTGLAAFIASAVGSAKGERHRSKLLTSLAFGSYNKHCAKEEGPFAWLSTDAENVRRYEADPLCGFMFTVAGFKALFSLLGFVNGPDWPKTVPTDLPVLLISGEDDPVGAYGKGVKKVASMLGGEGVKHLTVKLFRGDRHEILNETDRAEVWAYIDRWLGDLPAAAADAGEEDK
jgi:alpha-beta hydrolase superfamily lysophospholipase